ncbi:uncharacterized protein JCM6883_001428 [Sporobolomyces salmoneus]|uniref:uncharacterized protein n=1 Tax=Sporobolomyces salmoneus TaxID=183962 RepID=UPI00316D4C8C
MQSHFPRFSALSLLLVSSLLFSLFGLANSQGVTTITDGGGEILTTSVSPTVYTTNGEVYTFVPSTPATPTPSIRSFGSVQNLQDYMASRSQKGVAASAPPVTATAVVGDGGGNKMNLVQANKALSRSSRMSLVGISLSVAIGMCWMQ